MNWYVIHIKIKGNNSFFVTLWDCIEVFVISVIQLKQVNGSDRLYNLDPPYFFPSEVRGHLIK